MRHENAPTWLTSVMGKSGLFTDYLIKMAQVITWFSRRRDQRLHLLARRPAEGAETHPAAGLQPRRRGQNEMMVHRGEANGRSTNRPRRSGVRHRVHRRPPDRDNWLLKNGDEVIARHHTDELRFLVHWSAEVFEDFDELKKNMDGTDDLTVDKAIDMLVDDLGQKGHQTRRAGSAAARPGVHRRPQRRVRPRRSGDLPGRSSGERLSVRTERCSAARHSTVSSRVASDPAGPQT